METPVIPSEQLHEESPQTAPAQLTPAPPKKRRPPKPETIMALIAAAAALLLAAVLLMSRPYFPQESPVLGEEDPEALLHQQATEEELPWPPLETYLEPTI